MWRGVTRCAHIHEWPVCCGDVREDQGSIQPELGFSRLSIQDTDSNYKRGSL